MGLEAAQELTIRQALATTIDAIDEAGFVIPAPLYCNGIEEFWGTLDGTAINTKDEIEQGNVAACWIYPLQYSDDLTSSKPDSPLVNFTYEFYLFRQYGLEREDETATPEIFNSQVLKLHNKFVKAWLDIKTAFQGNRSLGLDSGIFVQAITTSIVQPDFIQNQSQCEFVPGVVGFAVKLRETVRYKLVEC